MNVITYPFKKNGISLFKNVINESDEINYYKKISCFNTPNTNNTEIYILFYLKSF